MDFQYRYTGHPFVDVGIGAVLAIADGDKQDPEELTVEDLEHVAQMLKVWYCEHPAMQNYISIIFPNASFTQPKMKLEDKHTYADQMLFAFRRDELADDGQRCAFFPELKPMMQAKRQHIPLLNSEETGNFSALGIPGLPVSGLALLFIHAMPLGCFKCGGRYLVFHQLSRPGEVDAGSVNRIMAQKAWEQIESQLTLNPDKFAPYGSHRRTRYVDALLNARLELDSYFDLHNVSGYYFTNYGTGADVEVLQLTNLVVDFVNLARQDHADAWQDLVRRAWQVDKKQPEEGRLEQRNDLYEMLFDIPYNPRPFLMRLLDYRHMALITLFLRKVMKMQDTEIQLYMSIGQQLADYMHTYDYNVSKKSLSWGLYHQLKDAKYPQLQKLLRHARERVSKSGQQEVLIPIDKFINAFIRTRRTYGQYELARDLVAYALFDRLHALGHTMRDSKAVEEEGSDTIAQEYALAIQQTDEE